nr:fatty acyl-CoA reductase 2-like [Rhipicephalus microplus]
MVMDMECLIDVVPVDIVANTLICIAWRTSTTRFVQRYKNTRKIIDVGQYFLTHGWLFRTSNVERLACDLSPKDKQSFNIDVRRMDWYPYWDNYLLGIRKYLFKAQDSDLPKDRRQVKRLYVVRLSSRALLLVLVCQLMMTTTV